MSRLRRWLAGRIGSARDQGGMTLVELLVAAAMSVVVVGAATSMLISAVQDQPKLSKRSQDISTARFILERMTREIRNGIAVDSASGSKVSFRGYVRSATCGGTTMLPAASTANLCEITYDCSSAVKCTRTETAPGIFSGGTPKTIFTGINSASVFNFSPNAEEATFVGVTLRFPTPGGTGFLTISDGATLRGGGLFS